MSESHLPVKLPTTNQNSNAGLGGGWAGLRSQSALLGTCLHAEDSALGPRAAQVGSGRPGEQSQVPGLGTSMMVCPCLAATQHVQTLLGQTVATAQNGAQSRPASPARKGRRGQKGGAHGHLTLAALGLGLDQRFRIPREQKTQDGNHKEKAEEAEGNFPGLEDPSFHPEMAHLSRPEETHLGHFPGELSHTGNKERIQKPPERE